MSIFILVMLTSSRRESTASRFAAGVVVCLALTNFMALPALAQVAVAKGPASLVEKQSVAVVLTQFKVIKGVDGTEQLQDAASVKPGDTLEYKATYTNNTGKTVTGLVADLPIPEGLDYLPRSAKPGAALVKAASADGVFATEPLTHTISGRTEPVPYSDYRSLRWTLGQLPANGIATVTARARVQIVEVVAPKVPVTAPQLPQVTVQPVASGAPR